MKNKIFSENKGKTAFTLIELMVVVAVIAILATLGVANFSAAIKRTRNAGRQADIQAVAKALETCFDVRSGVYTSIPDSNETGALATDSVKGAPFYSASNTCLNNNILPKMANFPYTISYRGSTHPQLWVVCAQLEQVANWESVGNSNVGSFSMTATSSLPDFSPCAGTACFFCVKSQQ